MSMGVVIQKFGGKLLETPDLIRRAAAFVTFAKDAGDDPVVVVSAPGRTTDQFIQLAHQITPNPDQRELDMLLSVGERTAMALLAMAINAGGKWKARSFTGSQVGIITDTRHTDARILEVKGYRLREALEQGEIPIVAGFQGVSTEREITTLGRGGSDATAVALAAALGAERCELVKESGGVFSADPEIVPEAVEWHRMDYGTLEGLTAAGAQVVQPRAASLARQHRVNLIVRGTDDRPGTLVTDHFLNTGIAAVVLKENLVFHQSRPPGVTPIMLVGWGEHFCCVTEDPRSAGQPVAMITIVGWGGRLDPEAVERAGGVLAAGRPLAATMLHGAAAWVLAAETARAHLRKVHAALHREGFIRPSDP